MITITFPNHRIQYLEPRYINNLMESFRDSIRYNEATKLIEQYSFTTWDNLKNFTNENIEIQVHEVNSLPLYSLKGFESLLKILEPIYLYRRKQFNLLQVNILPDDIYIYTYSGVWESDFDSFLETPKGTYNWDNCPVLLNSPLSNMQIQHYDPNAHIAIVYHYCQY